MARSRPRVAPERRTRIDLLISALIIVVVLMAGAVIWWFSPVRHTTSDRAHRVVPAAKPTHRPGGTGPALAGAIGGHHRRGLSRSLVITGDDGSVIGRDPATGSQVWRYHRNRRPCAVLGAWRDSIDTVLSVYGNSRGCGEVTALDGDTGARTGARTSDADDAVNLAGGSGYAGTGPHPVGGHQPRARHRVRPGRRAVKPDAQPQRTGCDIRQRCWAPTGSPHRTLRRRQRIPADRPGVNQDDDEKVRQFGSTIITRGTADGPRPR